MRSVRALGPATVVTLGRLGLVLVVGLLIAVEPSQRAVIAGLATVALVLDGIDGWVARRTRTASSSGARLDMEVDALLVLILAIDVAARMDVEWVLLIGGARYLLAIASWVAPWLRTPVRPRLWRKAVAVMQTTTLIVVGTGQLPRGVALAALACAGVALAASFGTQVWELRAGRAWSSPVTTGLALGLVWAVLVAPERPGPTWAWAGQLPLEGLAGAALLTGTRGRLRVASTALLAALLASLAVLKALDRGLWVSLGRPFDPLSDASHADSATGLARDSWGDVLGTLVVVGVVVAVLALALSAGWAVRRVARAVAAHRATIARLLVIGAIAWSALALLNLRAADEVPVAATPAAGVVVDHVRDLRASLADRRRFAAELAADPLERPTRTELAGLRGKDVLVVFVESYGRHAVDDSPGGTGLSGTIRRATSDLAAGGFRARSGFLTSPTFGGLSWLAHATLQSGLWVDDDHSYQELLRSSRTTLTGLFARQGWRTACVIPGNRHDWPPARTFYRCDRVYDSRNLGYDGPGFGYPPVPDQFTLAAFARDELGPGHAPVMAEIDLVSSHVPWSPLPRLLPWAELASGAAYDAGPRPQPLGEQAAYAAAIEYSLTSLVSFVRHAANDDLVLVVLGDHQPYSGVSGTGATHDVPISVIAHDPEVLAATDDWGWTPGLLPAPDAPVWPMSDFRERFLTSFGGDGLG